MVSPHPRPLARRPLGTTLRWIVALAAFPLTVAAQGAPGTGVIVGIITDRGTSQPIDAARLSVVGTSLATQTDQRGRAVLRTVPAGTHSVRVSRIGFRPETQQVTVVGGDSVRVTFALLPSAVELEAVVTTGTGGAVEKRKIGSSMGVVDVSKAQEQLPTADIGTLLQSKVTGLRSISGGGGAGGAKDLRIRGIASLSLNQRPVVYIDGVRADTRSSDWVSSLGSVACCAFAGGNQTDRMNDLNPNDIERIEVLKGAAAATLYGSEATNGVIQIFTKKGRADSRASWSAGVTSGFDRLRANLPTKHYPNFTGTDGTVARDANSLIENGMYQQYDLSVQGGGTRNTYFISGGWLNHEGSIQPNAERRGTLRLNLTFAPTDKWNFDSYSSFVRNDVDEVQAGNNWVTLLGNMLNGDPRKATAARPFGEAWAPVSDIKRIETGSSVNRWTGGVTARYSMRPNFTHKVTVGLDAVNDQKGRFFPFDGDYGTAGVTKGQRNLAYRNYSTYTADYLGNLSFTLPFTKIGSDLSFGANGLWENERRNIAIGNEFAGPGVTTVSSSARTTGGEAFSETITIGAYAQNRFSFGEKLFLTLGLRSDGNSAFGENFGFKTYPKADVSFVPSEYGIFPEWVNSVKLRAAIGQAGKAPRAFDRFTTFTTRSVFAGTPGVIPDNPGNEDLRPETSTETEGGIEAGFFNDRVSLEGSYYRQVTRDAIVNKTNPPSEGFQTAKRVNLGQIVNNGWEASLTVVPVRWRSFDWTTNLRMDGNKNEVTSLGGLVLGGNNFRVGYPAYGIWNRVPKSFAVVNGKPVTTLTDTAVYIGSPLPSVNGSLGNTLRLGPLQLYSLFTMERGAWFSNGDRPYRVRQGGSPELLQFLDAAGKPTFQYDSVANFWLTQNAVDKRDNVRLREISLTYLVPETLVRRLGLGATSLTVAGQNLMWWDDCNCVDPNMVYNAGESDGITSGFLAQPAPRQFRISLRTRF